jgi:hypothetical protein
VSARASYVIFRGTKAPNGGHIPRSAVTAADHDCLTRTQERTTSKREVRCEMLTLERTGGTRITYDFNGDGPAIVLTHSFLFDHSM